MCIGLLDVQGRKKGNLDSWFSDASQPFNKYANHFPVVKVNISDLCLI